MLLVVESCFFQFSFAAVNCFTAQGQCRKTYKAHAFPVIVAYVGRTAVMYNGEIAVDFIYRYVNAFELIGDDSDLGVSGRSTFFFLVQSSGCFLPFASKIFLVNAVLCSLAVSLLVTGL